jgi:hypothetical protein
MTKVKSKLIKISITAVKNYIKKSTATVGKLIIAVYASVVYVYIFLHINQVGQSIIPDLLDQGVRV